MKLCDRCPGAGSCLLSYLGKACYHWRKTNAPDVFVTNADRIRAMSDEELAKWLCEFDAEVFAAGVLKYGAPLMNERERLAWLQQPAEEDV